jgi:hypothetical protein
LGSRLRAAFSFCGDVCCWQILLQKSFLGDERNFLGPLMRFVCGDVRDLIVSHKNDHGPWHRRYRALQRKRRLKIRFREIFGVVRFSTFATISALFGHGAMSELSPLSGVKRKSDFGAVRPRPAIANPPPKGLIGKK